MQSWNEDNDPLKSNLSKICKCFKPNGKSFVAKLIAIDGDFLYFETKTGRVIMNKRSSLESIAPYQPIKEVV